MSWPDTGRSGLVKNCLPRTCEKRLMRCSPDETMSTRSPLHLVWVPNTVFCFPSAGHTNLKPITSGFFTWQRRDTTRPRRSVSGNGWTQPLVLDARNSLARTRAQPLVAARSGPGSRKRTCTMPTGLARYRELPDSTDRAGNEPKKFSWLDKPFERAKDPKEFYETPTRLRRASKPTTRERQVFGVTSLAQRSQLTSRIADFLRRGSWEGA